MYDLIIIGGGPAGSSAGVYSARKKLKTLLITKNFGGQSFLAPDIQNWLGNLSISGKEFSQMMDRHVKSYQGEYLEILEGKQVTFVNKTENGSFTVQTKEEQYLTKAVLICTGGKRRKLKVPGADLFEQKGITYCATCDAPMFSNQNVAVIGGGNSGFGSALQLSKYAQSITILEYSNQINAEPIRVEEALKRENIKYITNVEIKEIKGEKLVTSLIYEDRDTKKSQELDVSGVFVEIGMIPSTDFIRNLVEIDEQGYVKINHQNQQTSTNRVWAAGDCTDSLYKQNIIAAGDGAKAVENIFEKIKLN
jgi:alkyl hydroperoxide reductase subunit F